RFLNDKKAALIGADRIPLTIDDICNNPRQRARCRTRFGWNNAGNRRNHDGSCFGLPPGVNDGTPFSADLLPVPDPCRWIDRLADGAQQTQTGKIVSVWPVV